MTDASRTAQAAEFCPAARSRHARRLAVAALLLLFVGSGCAALIYEIVWFQLLQLVIGSSAVSLGVLLGTFMGGMCLGSLLLPRVVSPRAPSAARLRRARARHRRHRRCSCCSAMPLVGGIYTAWARHGLVGHPAARRRRGRLPAAADAADGRDAAGDRALGRDDAARRLVAGLLLRRQHRRRGVRLPARRLLPAARLRHGDGDLRRRRRSTSPWRRSAWRWPASHAARRRAAARQAARAGARARRRPGRSTSRSRCRGCPRWRPRWSGRACCRCCSARRSTRSRSSWRCS